MDKDSSGDQVVRLQL